MRFVWFNLMPWPDLPEDFREKYRSVWVDIGYATAVFAIPDDHSAD